MIRRNGSNRSTPSVVNDATSEHLNLTEGIRDDRPITDLKCVANSINFDSAPDGSYLLRNPLIKKETFEEVTNTTHFKKYFLYNGDIIYFDIYNATLNILHNGEPQSVSIRWYVNNTNFEKVIGNTVPWIINTYEYLHTNDATYIAVQIEHDVFKEQTESYLIKDDLGYKSVIYRFLKIYQDVDNS